MRGARPADPRCASTRPGALPDPFSPGATASDGERIDMDLLQWLFTAKIEFAGGQFLLLREVLGNVFGLLSALGGMRRKVWAWPIGILGNLLLFTVFLGDRKSTRLNSSHVKISYAV